MALTARQRAFYKSFFDVWRFTSLPKDANGSVTTPTYVRVQEGVPARHQTTFHHNKAGVLGRGQEDNLITEDEFHFEASVEVHDSDILVKRSGLQTGTGYQVMGLPEMREAEGTRTPNYNHAKGRKCALPKEIADFYA